MSQADTGIPGESSSWAADPAAGTDRWSTVERARRQWTRRLIDYSRRNNLLYHRPLLLGSHELEDAHEASLFQLIAGVRTPVARLLPRADISVVDVDEQLLALRPDLVPEEQIGIVRRIEAIKRRARENFEERGLETMHLAYGMASWTVEDGGRPPDAPVILVPITAEARGERIALQRRADPELNLALLHLLGDVHGCPPLDEELVGELDDADTADVGRICEAIFAQLAQAAASVPGFTVARRAVIGNFSYQKLAMVRDLARLGDQLAGNDIVAAMAGDTAARALLLSRGAPVDPRGLDSVAPDHEFAVRDADSSQQRVVLEVLGGRSGVIAGPPGTGKSQTIANLVAELAANGRRVLFVAEKSAALEVVKQRLEDDGLGHLILDLHGSVTKREVMAQFAGALELVRDAVPVDASQVHREYARRRDLLAAHTARMNRPRAGAGLSVFTLMGLLLRAPESSRSVIRFRGSQLEALTPERVEQLEELLTVEGSLADLLMGTNPSPWAASVIATAATAQSAYDAAVRMNTGWPALRQALEGVLGETRLRWPANLAEVDALADIVELAARLDATYSPELFALDLEEVERGIALGVGRGLGKALMRVTYPQYRSAERRLVELRRVQDGAEDLPAEVFHDDVLAALRVRAAWRRDGEPGAPPRGSGWTPHLRAAAGELRDASRPLQRVFPASDVAGYPLAQLPDLLGALAADAVTPFRVARHNEVTGRLGEAGMSPLIDLIRAERRAPADWVALLRTAWWQSLLDAAWVDDPELGAFDGRTHDLVVTQFRRFDRDRLGLAAQRVRRAHAEHCVALMNARPEQTQLVRHEAGKRVRHLPIRRLISEAGEVLTALKPCWMASPLSVSQLLDGQREHFDVVVFDEASQVLPEDAVTAIVRGHACVVAGDAQQLPPTPFFVADPDGEDGGADDAEATEGFESLLDIATTLFTPWQLRWHYRSTDERLIAFSNATMYGGALVTFPGTATAAPVRLVLVERTPGDTRDDSSTAEVARVVELVRAHSAADEGRSLGVITLGLTHARRLEAALRQAAQADPRLARLLDGAGAEGFFVKNLERVQGDERDDVILSLGFQKSEDGRLLYRFGPIVAEGGERRLNVAVTRARRSMTVVSSFSHHDMDPERSPSAGVRLLRQYLAYAAGEGQTTPAAGPARPISERTELERDVEEALARQGLRLTPQLGSSRFRVDLALEHPQRPGAHVLAVECDGPAYAAAPTARDRDRLRREQLERLGWSHTRVWATDWYLRRDAEVARILDEHRAAVQRFDLRERGELDAGEASTARPAAATAAPQRGARPPVPVGREITDYTGQQIGEVVRWVLSDGRMRTDDEIVAEVAAELGFERVDGRVDATIRAVVRPAW